MCKLSYERNAKLLDCYQRMNPCELRATDRCIGFVKDLLSSLPMQPILSFSKYGSIKLDFLDENHGSKLEVEINDLYCVLYYMDKNQVVYKRVPKDTIYEYLKEHLNNTN